MARAVTLDTARARAVTLYTARAATLVTARARAVALVTGRARTVTLVTARAAALVNLTCDYCLLPQGVLMPIVWLELRLGHVDYQKSLNEDTFGTNLKCLD